MNDTLDFFADPQTKQIAGVDTLDLFAINAAIALKPCDGRDGTAAASQRLDSKGARPTRKVQRRRASFAMTFTVDCVLSATHRQRAERNDL